MEPGWLVRKDLVFCRPAGWLLRPDCRKVLFSSGEIKNPQSGQSPTLWISGCFVSLLQWFNHSPDGNEITVCRQSFPGDGR